MVSSACADRGLPEDDGVEVRTAMGDQRDGGRVDGGHVDGVGVDGVGVAEGAGHASDGDTGRRAGGREGVSDASLRAQTLRERWFACSSALGWSSPAEWPHPTVDAVCTVICVRMGGKPAIGGNGDGGIERSLARWAGARAAAGVSLAETLLDLAALHTAVSGMVGGAARPELVSAAAPTSAPAGGRRAHGSAARETPTVAAPGERGREDKAAAGGFDGARLLRAVALSWTDVACGELADTAAVDPLSGLASVRYLRTRLGEVYRAARARGRCVGDDHALVAVTVEVRGWTRVAPLIVVGEAAGAVFDAGETLAVVGRTTVVVLAPRDGLAERTRVLRRLLARRLGPELGVERAPSVRIVGLPATREGASALLERLRQADETPARRPETTDAT